LEGCFHEFFTCEFGTGEGLDDVRAVFGMQVLPLFYA
jgi:hypothetical protein